MPDSLPDAFIFMKVGNHAGETFEEILARKRKEVQAAGSTFWGYGGTTLHPLQHVQPFARLTVKQQGSVYLVMEPMESRAAPDILPAQEFSTDGVNWQPLPEGIRVTGSRYALILNEITPGELSFPLNEFEVAIGRARGSPAVEYIRGRVDKGCFVRRQSGLVTPSAEPMVRKIGYKAPLIEPYAVLLR